MKRKEATSSEIIRGSGGKVRKPSIRSHHVTPYQHPNETTWWKKIVGSASSLLTSLFPYITGTSHCEVKQDHTDEDVRLSTRAAKVSKNGSYLDEGTEDNLDNLSNDTPSEMLQQLKRVKSHLDERDLKLKSIGVYCANDVTPRGKNFDTSTATKDIGKENFVAVGNEMADSNKFTRETLKPKDEMAVDRTDDEMTEENFVKVGNNSADSNTFIGEAFSPENHDREGKPLEHQSSHTNSNEDTNTSTSIVGSNDDDMEATSGKEQLTLELETGLGFGQPSKIQTGNINIHKRSNPDIVNSDENSNPLCQTFVQENNDKESKPPEDSTSMNGSGDDGNGLKAATLEDTRKSSDPPINSHDTRKSSDPPINSHEVSAMCSASRADAQNDTPTCGNQGDLTSVPFVQNPEISREIFGPTSFLPTEEDWMVYLSSVGSKRSITETNLAPKRKGSRPPKKPRASPESIDEKSPCSNSTPKRRGKPPMKATASSEPVEVNTIFSNVSSLQRALSYMKQLAVNPTKKTRSSSASADLNAILSSPQRLSYMNQLAVNPTNLS